MSTKTSLLIVALVIAVWGILGIMDAGNLTYSGYDTDPGNRVTRVESGSPAETAGIMVGDRITSVSGVAVEDVRALGRLPRQVPGSTQEIGIEREGQAMSVSLTYAGQTSRDKALGWVSVIIGAAFLFFGLRAYAARPGPVATRFAMASMGFALISLPGPYVASPTLRNLVGLVTVTVVVFAFAALLHFLLAFPSARGPVRSGRAGRLYWAPAVLTLMFAYLFLAQPNATGGFNRAVGTVIGLYLAIYFGWCILSMFQTYRSSSPEQRAQGGLAFMTWATVLAFAPLVIGVLVNLVSPGTALPGSDFYGVALILVPISFGMAIAKSAADESPAAAM
jgi:hypothetical protein